MTQQSVSVTWEPPKATLDATERFTFTCCNDERSLIPFDPGGGPGVDLAREESKGWVGYSTGTLDTLLLA